jgi:phospholipid-transporting ATPase
MPLHAQLLPALHCSLRHRQGRVLADEEDPGLAQHRERFFNFYDKRIMAGAWTGTPSPEIAEMFLRLLAVCHTVIPDGPQTE